MKGYFCAQHHEHNSEEAVDKCNKATVKLAEERTKQLRATNQISKNWTGREMQMIFGMNGTRSDRPALKF